MSRLPPDTFTTCYSVAGIGHKFGMGRMSLHHLEFFLDIVTIKKNGVEVYKVRRKLPSAIDDVFKQYKDENNDRTRSI